MKVAVVKETFPGERRVALVPANVPQLAKLGVEVVVEPGAGAEAGFADQDYVSTGAHMTADRAAAFSADVIVQVRGLGANPHAGADDLPRLRSGQFVIAMCDPLGEPESIRRVAETGASLFALELVPRITRAQAMDVLSSMATIAGYRAVLLAATELPMMLPMVTYAAGMLRPARVFVIGAGVAGLRAIATAKQLGAVVQAHDIRPTSREEVQSVGAKFVELKLDADTQDAGGYAKQLTDADYQRQRELIAQVAADSDVIITTAAIPGRQSPLLVTEAAVHGMRPGSVIVDLAAERGGNCELTKADERIVVNGVTIFGPTNTPSEVPTDASRMYSSNLTRFLQALIKEGKIVLNLEDEVIRETLVAHEGQVVSSRIRETLGMPVELSSVAGLEGAFKSAEVTVDEDDVVEDSDDAMQVTDIDDEAPDADDEESLLPDPVDGDRLDALDEWEERDS